MTTITFPSDTADIIDKIRGAIGRDVDFYIPSLSGCSVCSLDPTTNESTDSFCPSCEGIYWIPTYKATTISGHIIWKPSDELEWTVGGQVFDGDVRVQIKYTTDNRATVSGADYVVVDAKQMEIKKTTFRGVPALNRILVDMIERTKDG